MMITRIGSHTFKCNTTRQLICPTMVTFSSIIPSQHYPYNNHRSTGEVTSSFQEKNPSLEVARNMKVSFNAMDNKDLIILANQIPAISGAREEVLKRHIMR